MQIKAHNTDFSYFQIEELYLFSDQFDFAMWLVVPLCKSRHWIFIVAYLSKVEIHLYNLSEIFEQSLLHIIYYHY
jgi:hypothetical protein